MASILGWKTGPIHFLHILLISTSKNSNVRTRKLPKPSICRQQTINLVKMHVETFRKIYRKTTVTTLIRKTALETINMTLQLLRDIC